MSINAPKGTKDIMPEDSCRWRSIESSFDEICRRYGFGEIRTPMFEYTELFSRGIGTSTDVVQKEMYTFEDKGGRSITLKPEGTSPVVRAFIQSRNYAGVQPNKYYYNTSCFRYEKPQAGRLREFHQFGVESFGSKSMMADAEVIALADEFLRSQCNSNLELRINSVGCRKCRPIYRSALQDFFRPHYDELCDTCKSRFDSNPMRILDCKSSEDKLLAADAPRMMDYLCDECRSAFDELKSYLDAMKIKYIVDSGIVRGLDYYTKTAFEFVTDKLGAQDTVCGGGRYDHLIEEIGAIDMPGVGFGLGKERLLMLLEMESDTNETKIFSAPEILLAYIGEEAKLYTLDVLRELRTNGIRAAVDVADRGLKGQMKYADKIGAAYTAVIGDDEIKSGEITIKNMKSGEQHKVNRNSIIKKIKM